jgi:hypothetical protein
MRVRSGIVELWFMVGGSNYEQSYVFGPLFPARRDPFSVAVSGQLSAVGLCLLVSGPPSATGQCFLVAGPPAATRNIKKAHGGRSPWRRGTG